MWYYVALTQIESHLVQADRDFLSPVHPIPLFLIPQSQAFTEQYPAFSLLLLHSLSIGTTWVCSSKLWEG